MVRKDDISSTDKLLKLIRGSFKNGLGQAAELRSILDKWTTGKRRSNFTVGVEVGYDRLRLAKIGKKKQLLDFRETPFPPDVTMDSPKFSEFLKETLVSFGSRTAMIWSGVPGAGLETRLLRIPKVPSKQIGNAVLWSFKKENPFNEKESIFDFDVLGEVIEEGIKKIEVLAYTVPIKDVENLDTLFRQAGYALSGITAVPFAVQNLFRTEWLKQSNGPVCNLYVGRNWSRIDIFDQKSMVLSRGIKTGINSMIEAIRDRYNERLARNSGGIVVEIDGMNIDVPDQEKPIDMEQAREIFQVLFYTTPPGKSILTDPEEIFDMLVPVLDRLVRQLERTLEHYTQKLRGSSASQILTSGPLSCIPSILEYISRQLGVPVEAMDPLGNGAPYLVPADRPKPTTIAERSTFTPAIGLALSGNDHTPNFIYTYKAKYQEAATKMLHNIGLMVFLVIMVFLSGVYVWEGRILKVKKEETLKVQKELSQFTPNIGQEVISQALTIIKQNKSVLAEYSRRYHSLALVNEIAAMTPQNIRLLNLALDIGPAPGMAESEKPTAGGGSPKKIVKIEGIVSGERMNIEPALTQYILSLQTSPLFGQPNMKEQSMKVFQGREIMFFRAEIDIK
ncbi:MAG: hypothetical protein HQK55_03405 [Deltaproteobacteria bacterium]|nr:hypothetical protein [Deltaproteobacteria bacterium]